MWTVVWSASEPLLGNTETISTWPAIAAMSSHGARNCSDASWPRRPPASGTLATQARNSRPMSTPDVIGTRARSFKDGRPRWSASRAPGAHAQAGSGNHIAGRPQWDECLRDEAAAVKARRQLPIKRPWVRRGGGPGTDKESFP